MKIIENQGAPSFLVSAISQGSHMYQTKGGPCCFNGFQSIHIYTQSNFFQFISTKFRCPKCITSYLVLAAGHSKGIDKVHAFQMIGVCMVTWFTVYCKGGVPACPNDCSRTEFRMFRWKNVRWSSYEIYSWWVVTSQYICWRVFRDKRVAEHAQYKWGNHPTWGSPVHIPNMGIKMNRSNTKPGFPLAVFKILWSICLTPLCHP
jgi:hypothetical protein